MKQKIITNQIFDEERALYNTKNALILNCKFQGQKDGESVIKESCDFSVSNCSFSLRYPIWHGKNFSLSDSVFDDKARAPLWYCKNGEIKNCIINCVKALRESSNIKISNCEIDSIEFGWMSKDIKIKDCRINSQYFLLETKNVEIENLELSGKYTFQYMKNLHIKNSILNTKDAFWHSKNILVEDSIVKGEYLGWFSSDLTLKNCKIIGTQPLCYCKNLKLINCEMEKTDLSFEYSDVEADIKGKIDSIKNPKSGRITADFIEEIIESDSKIKSSAIIETRKTQNCA